MSFKQQYNIWKKRIENVLKNYFNDCITECNTIEKAAKYSMFSGGKRVRPVLMYAVADLIGVPYEKCDVFAAALEMIHTSSLIHDDLPAMDDDDLRRGKPTNHKVYGEAPAILTGDVLLTKPFEIAAEYMYKNGITKGYVKALWKLGAAVGYNGMIGGQIIDIESKPESTDENRLKLMHSKKTGALIDFAIKAPVYISQNEKEYEHRLDIYSKSLGQAFQIKDDILDYESNDDELGKDTKSDIKNNRATYVTILGIDLAKEKLEKCIENAYRAVKVYNNAEFLIEFANFVKNRST